MNEAEKIAERYVGVGVDVLGRRARLEAAILAYGEAVRQEQREADQQACRKRVEFDLSQAAYKERAGQHEEVLRLTAQAAGAQLCIGDINAAAVNGESK